MATEDLEKLLVQFNADFRGFQREMLKQNGFIDREVRKIERRFTQMNRNVSRQLQNLGRGLTGGIGRLGVVAGLGIGTKEVIDYADAWKRSKAQLQVAGVEIGRVSGKQQELLDVAHRARAEFTSTVGLFGRLSIAARDLGTSEAEVTRVTETLAKSLKIGGATAAESASVMQQFGQAIGKGFLGGDEFSSLSENAPIVIQAIAKEFGVTTGELKKMGAEGELISARIIKALLNVSEEVDKQFSAMPQTVGDAFTALQNNILEAIGVIDDGSGSTEKLVALINDLAAAIHALPALAGGVGKALQPVDDLLRLGQDRNAKSVEQALREGDYKSALVGNPGTTSRSFANFFMGSDLNDQLYEVNRLQERRLELEKQIADQVASGTNAGFPMLNEWRGELVAINEELARAKQVLGPSFESKGRGAQFPEYMAATGSSPPGKPKPPPTKKDRVDEYAREVEQIRERTAALREEAQIVTDLTGKENDYGFALEKARAMRDLLNAAEAQGLTITPALRAEIERLAEAQGRAAASADMARTGQQNWLQQQDDLRQKIEDQKDALVDTSVDFIGTFRDGILQGKSAVDSLNDSLSNLLSMLTDALLQEFMTRLIKGESGGGGDIVGALVNALPFAKGGIMTGHGSVPLKRYAKGGVANSPQLAMFGEGRRPEAYVPLPDGRSIPVKMQGGGGGGGVIVNIRNSSTGAVVRSGEARRRPDGRQEINLDVDDKIAAILNDPNSKSSQALDMRGARQPVVRRAR